MSKEQLKSSFISELGEFAWDERWESVARLSPEILKATIKLSAVPKHKKHLSLKFQQLCAIAVYAASTHFYEPYIEKHIKAALAAGATQAEIVETLELTGTLGIHV